MSGYEFNSLAGLVIQGVLNWFLLKKTFCVCKIGQANQMGHRYSHYKIGVFIKLLRNSSSCPRKFGKTV